jgi:hypothetical protein
MATISGSEIVAEVQKFINFPYVYGASGPSSFDCSGLVQYVLTTVGIKNVPRTSEEQWSWATHISQSQLQPGDLVFAQFPGDNASPGHVGIYIGNGQIESAEDPALGVGYSTLQSWGSNIVGYGRVPDTTDATTDADTTSALSGLGFAWPGDITGFFKDAKTFVDALMWLVNPASWLRIGAFGIGMLLLGFGVYALIKVGSDQPLLPQTIPVPVPA